MISDTDFYLGVSAGLKKLGVDWGAIGNMVNTVSNPMGSMLNHAVQGASGIPNMLHSGAEQLGKTYGPDVAKGTLSGIGDQVGGWIKQHAGGLALGAGGLLGGGLLLHSLFNKPQQQQPININLGQGMGGGRSFAFSKPGITG